MANNQLKVVYGGFDKVKKVRIREQIMDECGIPYSTFYNWIANPEWINAPSKKIFARVFKVAYDKLFPETVTA